MPKPRIYIDTSVIGGCLDEEFQPWSELLMALFQQGRAVAIVSSVVAREIEKAPPGVQAVLDEIPIAAFEPAELDAEAADLAQAYLDAGVLGEASRADAEHVAVAALARVDVLVSWNFRHIVNLNRIRLFNGVNMQRGLPTLEIRTPKEILSGNKNEEGV